VHQSFFSKLLNWFKSPSTDTPPEKPAVKPHTNNPPRRERDNRNSNSQRPDNSRQEGNRQRNNPRRDRDESNLRTEKSVQTSQKPQEPRTARSPRPPRESAEPAALENITKTVTIPEVTEGNSHNTGRKRGRRGGQRERERRDHQQAAGLLSNVQPAHTETTNGAVTNMTEPARHNEAIDSLHIQNTSSDQRPVDQTVAPVAPVASAAPAPSAMSDNGLVQIETDATKSMLAMSAAQQFDSAPPVSRRRPRPREIYSMDNNEPLVQIETVSKN
jgi:ribonuclease E